MPPKSEVWQEEKPFPDLEGIKWTIPSLLGIDVIGGDDGSYQLRMRGPYRVSRVLLDFLKRVDRTGDEELDSKVAGRLEEACGTIKKLQSWNVPVVLNFEPGEIRQSSVRKREIAFADQEVLNKAAAELAKQARTPIYIKPWGGVILQLQMAAAKLKGETLSP